MSRYSNQAAYLLSGQEVPLAGATVYVYTQAGALATLTADGGGALTNPVTTDQYGNFYFNTGDGLYTLTFHYAGKEVWSENAVEVGEGLPLPDSVLLALAEPSILDLLGAGVFWTTPEAYGAVRDGVTDDSAAFIAAMAAIYAAGGGILMLALGAYYLASRITLPNDGIQHGTTTPASQPPITWQGRGNDCDWPADGTIKTTFQGTSVILGFQDTTPGWAGIGARLQTLGRGMFRLRGLNISSPATSGVLLSTPLLLTTNTALDIDGSVTFIGPSNRANGSADCDAIILGGLTTALTNTAGNNAAFQGYDTTIRDVHFQRIRRIVYCRTYCNGLLFTGLKAYLTCGTNIAGGGAVEINGFDDNCVGNVFLGGTIETTWYHYSFVLTKAAQNHILYAGTFDAQVGTLTLGVIYCSATAANNTFEPGVQLGNSAPFVVEATPNTNTIGSDVETTPSRFFNIKTTSSEAFPSTMAATNFVSAFNTIAPTNGNTGISPFVIKQTTAGGGSGTSMFEVGGDGTLIHGAQSGAGNATCAVASSLQVSGNGRIRTSGGQQINKSTANYIDNWAVRHRFYDSTGATFWGGFTGSGLAVGNSAAATTLGTVVKKMEVFDATGTSLGFVPIYNAIT